MLSENIVVRHCFAFFGKISIGLIVEEGEVFKENRKTENQIVSHWLNKKDKDLKNCPYVFLHVNLVLNMCKKTLQP